MAHYLLWDDSELLAKTSEEVSELHKQQLNSSRSIAEISTVVQRLDTSIQDWVEGQRRQLDDMQKKLQSNQDTVPGIFDTNAVLTRRTH